MKQRIIELSEKNELTEEETKFMFENVPIVAKEELKKLDDLLLGYTLNPSYSSGFSIYDEMEFWIYLEDKYKRSR